MDKLWANKTESPGETKYHVRIKESNKVTIHHFNDEKTCYLFLSDWLLLFYEHDLFISKQLLGNKSKEVFDNCVKLIVREQDMTMSEFEEMLLVTFSK